MSSLFQTYGRWDIDLKKQRERTLRIKTAKRTLISFRGLRYQI